MIFGNSAANRSRSWKIVTLALLALAVPFSARANPAWTMDRLMSALTKVKSRRVPYTETTTMAILSTPVVSSGTLSFTAPARLTQHVTSPEDETFQADGDALRVLIPSRDIDHTIALRDDPVAWALVEGFRATFAGDETALRRFYTLALSGDEKGWSLTLNPKLPQMAAKVTAIRIEGGADRIAKVTVDETGGGRMVMIVGKPR